MRQNIRQQEVSSSQNDIADCNTMPSYLEQAWWKNLMISQYTYWL